MKKLLKFGFLFGILTVFVGTVDAFAAKKQSAINIGTKVRGKVEAKGVYDQECYDAYYGCMDQFCIVDNEIGGSCNCSNEVKKHESALEEIKNMLAEAERIGTEEVEKVQAGANADIIFSGERKYDEKGNVIATKATKDKTEIKKSMWSTSSLYDTDEEGIEDDDEDSVAGKIGDELYDAANKICKAQMDEECAGDMKILTQMYSRQIASDCKGLANSIEQKKGEAKAALAEANKAVRSALKESLEESNKYDRGTCMVEYKKCMRSEDACGENWSNCVFTIASENMQNNKAESTAGTTVKTVNTYDITASTMEILESKRFICERVLDSCVAVRDLIWDDFLREAAPTIRLAEQNVESDKRQSCLKDISDCIQKACKDDIEGKGEATMDACLARPDMARSFCKVQIDPCERMEPQIWDYVVSKLASMRVDACTKEVKDCFTSEDRCGKDFVNCIGMDYQYIHDICPIDKLVVCKQTREDFKMSDLDDMLMGLYLNIDNKALDNCQKLAEEIMTEHCGSTTDCNAFASDEYLGTGSIKEAKAAGIHRIAGLITFGKIKMGDAGGTVKDGGKQLKPGELGVEDYIKEITEKNSGLEGADAIIAAIGDELNNIAGTINRTISLLEANQKIQFCITGRDLTNIKGSKEDNNSRGKKKKKQAEMTSARFPNLLNEYRTVIAMAALRQAQDNYNKKWQELVTKATKEASADVAEYMCNMLPSGTGNIGLSEETPLVTPFSIVYDIGQGVSQQSLTKKSKGKSEFGGASRTTSDSSMMGGAVAGALAGAALGPAGLVAGAAVGGLLGSANQNKQTIKIPGGQREVWSTFNREDRICHFCSVTSTQACESTGHKGWFKDTRGMKCSEAKVKESCEDIEM